MTRLFLVLVLISTNVWASSSEEEEMGERAFLQFSFDKELEEKSKQTPFRIAYTKTESVNGEDKVYTIKPKNIELSEKDEEAEELELSNVFSISSKGETITIIYKEHVKNKRLSTLYNRIISRTESALEEGKDVLSLPGSFFFN